MIIQGSNAPIILCFEEEFERVSDISVALIKDNRLNGRPNIVVHRWGLEDIELHEDERTAICPLTQEETLSFPEGKALLEVKWLDSDGDVWMGCTVKTEIGKRFDKTILEEEDGN